MEEQSNKDRENADRKMTVRFTPKEYRELEKAFRQTIHRKISQYARAVLLHEPITIYTRNQSLDGFVFEMVRLRTELSAIGKNLNQAVKKLHSLSYLEELKSWTKSFENSHAELLQKVAQIDNRIAQLSDTWSPESPA